MVGAGASFSVGFTAMASRCEVRIAAASQQQADELARPAIAEVARIETKYSRYRADSVLSVINASAGAGWVKVDAETGALLDYAATLYANSGGSFDITSGVLRRAWNFRETRLPREDELAPLLALIGWGRVQREGDRVRLPVAGMEIDFGGFGKEYAADRAAAVLARLGVRHGYVNLGGDLHVIGPQGDGSAWLIGIQDPRDEHRLVASIPVSTGALATSGDYERFIEVEGKRYCHILDPSTGLPASYWRSVSVLAPVCIGAGSFATLAMLRGEDAVQFLDESQLAYLAIDHAGRVFRQELK
jgi:thiamine biosynthesis lipoprotein